MKQERLVPETRGKRPRRRGGPRGRGERPRGGARRGDRGPARRHGSPDLWGREVRGPSPSADKARPLRRKSRLGE